MFPKTFFWVVIFSVSFMSIILTGCSFNVEPSYPPLILPNVSSCQACACARAKPQQDPCRRWSWGERFHARGIQLIQVGDQIKFILPTDYFFCSRLSPTLDPKFTCGLDMIAAFICGLDKMNVKVAGYTDDEDCHLRNVALSRQQAQVIANYLWKRGIDTRLLYAVGYGECFPIACNERCKGRFMNRRIEITLRKITDDYDQ